MTKYRSTSTMDCARSSELVYSTNSYSTKPHHQRQKSKAKQNGSLGPSTNTSAIHRFPVTNLDLLATSKKCINIVIPAMWYLQKNQLLNRERVEKHFPSDDNLD